MAQRYEGKNLDEALTAASQALGVERYQLTYHVLLEKRGFLGGMKRVVIEAEVNDAPVQEPARSDPPPALRPAGSSRGGAGRERERGPRGGRGRGRGERGEGGHRGEGRGRREPRGDREFTPRQTGVVAMEAPEQGDESPAASEVRVWCEQVLRLARLDGVVRTEENDLQILVRIYGADAGLFIDRNGELLDAIQVLANKSLGGRKVEKDIELDCAAFKERRTEELGEKARSTAERVRRDGREQLLPAMSPIERRIVHLALAEDADVTTESRGEGFYKRVAIIPRAVADQQQES